MNGLGFAVNSFATGWLSLIANPGTPAEFSQAAQNLAQRSFFDQRPNAVAETYLTGAFGEAEGEIDTSGSEGDPLMYSVAQAPMHGTAQVTSDGQYTYTPSDGYTGEDSFTVSVTDPGLNLASPTSSRAESVTVKVGGSASAGQTGESTAPNVGGVWATNGFTIVNLTGRKLTVTSVTPEGQFESPIQYAPPVGTAVLPGDSVHLELTRYLLQDAATDVSFVDYEAALRGDYSGQWKVVLDSTWSEGDTQTRCDVGTCTHVTPEPSTGSTTIDLVDAPGTVWNFSSDSAWGNEVVKRLAAIADKTPNAKDEEKIVNISYVNAVYQSATPTGFTPSTQWVANLTPNENFTFTKTVNEGFDKTATSGWELGAQLGISKYVDFAVAGKYSVQETEVTYHSYQVTQQFRADPYSFTGIMVSAAPRVNVTGDISAELGPCKGSFCSSVNPNVTFLFHGVDYTYPDLSPGATLTAQPVSEPYQGDPPTNNLGFVLTDPQSPTNEPYYNLGFFGSSTTHQLQTYIHVGQTVASSTQWTSNSKFSSSDPTVATIDEAGLVTALKKGVTTITATYTWRQLKEYMPNYTITATLNIHVN